MEAMAENPSNRISTIPLKHIPELLPSSASHSQHPQESQFSSYNQTPDVIARARIFCDILTRGLPEVEPALASTGIQPAPEVVEEVLRLSYGSPSPAVKFFRWAGLNQKHSTRAWNLMVDLLGKNGLFEPMWDAIRSMKQEGVISVATFASVFGSYCVAGRLNEAFMTFDVMEKYGVQPDVVAVNSLLSAMCREDNQTLKAIEFFEKIKTKIPGDADSFAILLEGLEKEGNVAKAKNIFGEMVIRVGWSPENMAAYDAFLTTLVRGSHADEAIKFLQVMKGKNCLPGMKFFSSALDILVEQKDSAHAVTLWDIMVGSGLVPNLFMYNAIIQIICSNNDIKDAFRFLDEMVFNGAFPDSLTYNTIFHCLIKNKKVRETGKFFTEMIKNEWPPTQSNCAAAISLLFDRDDPEMAIEIWDYMLQNRVLPLDESANALLIGLCNMNRLSEVKRFADNMLERRIRIHESTMERLRIAFHKEGRSTRDTFDYLSRKWRSF